MNFLVDADLPRSTARSLTRAGHVAVDVRDAQLGSATDREIFDHAQAEAAVLVTRDLDFTDPLRFPDQTHHGLLIVRIREVLPPSFVNEALVRTVSALEPEHFPNAMIVVEEMRFRRRVMTGQHPE